MNNNHSALGPIDTVEQQQKDQKSNYKEIEIIHWHGNDFAVHRIKPLFVSGEFALHDTIYPNYSRKTPYAITHIPSHKLLKEGKNLQKLISLCKRLSVIKSGFNKEPPVFDRSRWLDLTPPAYNERDAKRRERLQWMYYYVSEEEAMAVIDWMRNSRLNSKVVAQTKEIIEQWEKEAYKKQ